MHSCWSGRRLVPIWSHKKPDCCRRLNAETSSDKRIINLFTEGSHHHNVSDIFLTLHQASSALQVLRYSKTERQNASHDSSQTDVSLPEGQKFLCPYFKTLYARCRLISMCYQMIQNLNGHKEFRPRSYCKVFEEKQYYLTTRHKGNEPFKQRDGPNFDSLRFISWSEGTDKRKKLQHFLNFQHQFLSSILSRADSIYFRYFVTRSNCSRNFTLLVSSNNEKEQVPITPELTHTPTGLGNSPFPTPPPFSRKRVQPPRKKKRHEWISYIKSSLTDRKSHHEMRERKS